MGVIRIIFTCIWMTIFPMAIGGVFLPLKERGGRLLFAWIYGQLTLWTGFQMICVPMILLEKNYEQIRTAYAVFCALLLAAAGIVCALHGKKGVSKGMGLAGVRAALAEKSRSVLLLWLLFACLFLIQIFCVFYLSYEDGDDAFYVAITTYCRGGKMPYRVLPYTGGSTSLDARHALAPFPVWVAILAEISGFSGAATAHVLMPLLILSLTYGLFYLLGEKWIGTDAPEEQWKLPLFLVIAALLVMFGGYSIYTPENFLLVRASQGKTVLGNVILPANLYLLLLFMERMEQKKKVTALLVLAFFVTVTAGCLCSSLGGVLLGFSMGITLLCSLIGYGRWKAILGLLPTLLVPAMITVIYVLLP